MNNGLIKLTKMNVLGIGKPVYCPACSALATFCSNHCGIDLGKKLYEDKLDNYLSVLREKVEVEGLINKLRDLESCNKLTVDILKELKDIGLIDSNFGREIGVYIKNGAVLLNDEATADELREISDKVSGFINKSIKNYNDKLDEINTRIKEFVNKDSLKVDKGALANGELSAFGVLYDYLSNTKKLYRTISNIKESIDNKIIKAKQFRLKINKDKLTYETYISNEAYLNGISNLVIKGLKALNSIEKEDYNQKAKYATLLDLIQEDYIKSLRELDRCLHLAGLEGINKFLKSTYNKVNDLVKKEIRNEVNELFKKVKPNKYKITYKEKPYYRGLVKFSGHSTLDYEYIKYYALDEVYLQYPNYFSLIQKLLFTEDYANKLKSFTNCKLIDNCYFIKCQQINHLIFEEVTPKEDFESLLNENDYLFGIEVSKIIKDDIKSITINKNKKLLDNENYANLKKILIELPSKAWLTEKLSNILSEKKGLYKKLHSNSTNFRTVYDLINIELIEENPYPNLIVNIIGKRVFTLPEEKIIKKGIESIVPNTELTNLIIG